MSKHLQQFVISFICSTVLFWLLVFWVYDGEVMILDHKIQIAVAYFLVELMLLIFVYVIPNDTSKNL